MNKLTTAIATLVLGAASMAAQHDQQDPHHAPHHASAQSQKIAGNWQFSMDTPHGKATGVFKIEQDGQKLNGTCEAEHGKASLTGSIDGKKVALDVSFPEHMTVKFEGTIDGGKMSGSTNLNGGGWTATRQEK